MGKSDTWKLYNEVLQRKLLELDELPLGDPRRTAAVNDVTRMAHILAEKNKADAATVKSVTDIICTILTAGVSFGCHLGTMSMYSDLSKRILSIEGDGVITTKGFGILTDFPKIFGRK